jgi:hypothetical protein
MNQRTGPTEAQAEFDGKLSLGGSAEKGGSEWMALTHFGRAVVGIWVLRCLQRSRSALQWRVTGVGPPKFHWHQFFVLHTRETES